MTCLDCGDNFVRSSTLMAFGFRWEKSDWQSITNYCEKDRYWLNWSNVVSWIPILCIISGIYHLIIANKADNLAEDLYDDKDLKAYATALRVRAAAEFFQASLFLAIIDLIVSIGRYLNLSNDEI